jgi:two-component system sensor histidine kinase TctE
MSPLPATADAGTTGPPGMAASADCRRRWPPRLQGASLHRQLLLWLLLWLLLPQLVLWGAAAWISYQTAAHHANAAIDASLSQATRSLARQVKPIGNGLFIDFPRAAQDIIEADPIDRVYYMVSTPPGQFILGNHRLPPPPASLGAPDIGLAYFFDGSMQIERDGVPATLPVRVAALYVAYGDDTAPQTMLVQIARSRTGRDVLAAQILRDTALPLSGLIVLMTLIVWAGIRAGLQPLAKLRRQVENRAADLLAPIALDAAPQEVRSLARALNTLLDAVQHNVEVQKGFISHAAHQLRTPLAGLKSQAELALQDTQDAQRLQEPAHLLALQQRLQRVQQIAACNAHLVNQLLTPARAEPESAAQHGRGRVDLARLARELTAEMVPGAARAGVDLGSDDRADGRALEVEGTARLLREALGNLVDNAMRYAGRGAVVTVRCQRDGGDAVRGVEDDGPGLTPAERERVFERFVRATHEGNGCGLGLAIVRDVVERHGGSMRLLPREPHGLVAQVRLPLAPKG